MDRPLKFGYQPHTPIIRVPDMSDFQTARINLVESQVRPNGVTDPRILDAMLRLPREEFVPAGKRAIAYMDEDIAITTPASGGPRRVLIEAMTFAKLAQLADIKPGDKVLQIGAGTGYGTAVLSHLAQSVVALEENAELAAEARARLERFGNVSVEIGPLAQGCRQGSPYDVIFVEGRIPEIPDALTAQLADGGRLVAVVGSRPVSKARKITKAGQTLSEISGFDATVSELPGFEARKPAFVF
jgi:protein-L-isoaspartate(D-aspartate) O-methyltransferase